MDKYFPKQLLEIYNSGSNDGMIKIADNQDHDDFNKQLHSLEVNDYVRVLDRSLGMAHVELTPNGIKFCEQISD